MSATVEPPSASPCPHESAQLPPLTPVERGRILEALDRCGVPEPGREEYLAFLAGLVHAAFDAYASERETGTDGPRPPGES